MTIDLLLRPYKINILISGCLFSMRCVLSSICSILHEYVSRHHRLYPYRVNDYIAISIEHIHIDHTILVRCMDLVKFTGNPNGRDRRIDISCPLFLQPCQVIASPCPRTIFFLNICDLFRPISKVL